MIDLPPAIEPFQDVRIALSAFRDAQIVLPRLSGRACLRRHAFKLQWWREGDDRALDLPVEPLGSTPFFGLVVDNGYGIASGYRIVFGRSEPEGTVWVLSIMQTDEPFSDNLFEILHMRMNVVRERMHISHKNPFGIQ